jgi:hypothetical protein
VFRGPFIVAVSVVLLIWRFREAYAKESEAEAIA